MAMTFTRDNDTSLRSCRRTRRRLKSYEPDCSQVLEELPVKASRLAAGVSRTNIAESYIAVLQYGCE